MAKSQKQTGYLVKIEAFVPAMLTDSKVLSDLQGWVERTAGQVSGAYPATAITTTITPTRR